jgi:hypothetical protein
LQRAAAAALLIVGATPVLPPAAPAQECCVTVDKPGRWTLPRLGFGALDVPVTGAWTRVTLPYRLPRDARQGPHDWYLLRLHFEIAFERGGGPGKAWVVGAGNHYGAVLLEFTRGSRGRSIEWNSLDLIKGWVERRTAAHRIAVVARNYLPYRGVRPGRNTLTISLRRAGTFRVKRLKVLADSGIEVTPHSPARLVLEADPPSGPIEPGEIFNVGYRVRNEGDRAGRQVVAQISLGQSGAPRVIGSDAEHLGRVADVAHGSFRLRAREAGRYRILLAVRSPANHPTKVVEVDVVSATAESSHGRVAMRLVAAAGLIAMGSLLVLRGRVRRRV